MFDTLVVHLDVGDDAGLLRGEQAQEESEAGHDETERHDGEPGTDPCEQRSLRGEEDSRITQHALLLSKT